MGRVLIGCEESGYIRSEFIRHGHDAWSCDLLPAADGSPNHMRCDILIAIAYKPWDLIILHPECTYMAVCGNTHYADSVKRQEAVERTQKLWKVATEICPRVCIEQPVSVLSLSGATKNIVQPWHFRVAESKKTVLHTTGLPKLDPWVTEEPEMIHEVVWKMSPSPDRSRKRGHLPWLARPMAEQWGEILESTT